ncbi:MAG TPA: hypothetical protein PKM21_01945 [Anaerolineales bacterium]|nr:hypothetical protein [Anaerolineales bacterium]
MVSILLACIITVLPEYNKNSPRIPRVNIFKSGWRKKALTDWMCISLIPRDQKASHVETIVTAHQMGSLMINDHISQFMGVLLLHIPVYSQKLFWGNSPGLVFQV